MERTENKRVNFFNRRRHFLQALTLFLFFLLPTPLPLPGWEEGFLRFDFTNRHIHFFGLLLVPGLFHLFFLAFLIPLFGLAVSSTLLSKVFCGWVCPQNIFFEMFEGVQKRLKKRFPKFRRSSFMQKGVDLTLAIFWGAAISWTAMRYFIDADPIFYTVGFLSLFLFFVYDTHLLKHRFCESACPYALIQKSFQDNNSLHVMWEQREGSPCESCHACETACYVGIDVKKDPFSVDCTMCGACVDACSRVYSRKPEPPLLTFGFGEKKGWLGINSSQKTFVLGSFALFLAFFAWAIVTRPTSTFRVDYPPSGTQFEPFLTDEREANRYRIRLRNMTGNTIRYILEVDDHFQLHSSNELIVAPYKALSEAITISRKPQQGTEEISFRLREVGGALAFSPDPLYFRPVTRAAHTSHTREERGSNRQAPGNSSTSQQQQSPERE